MPDLINNSGLGMALFLLQGVWGLFLIFLTYAFKRLIRDIEDNTKETTKISDHMNSLNVLLSGNYVTKSELLRLEDRFREQEKELVELKARDAYREQLRREGKL